MNKNVFAGSPAPNVIKNSDSVMDILAAQCSDLEALLVLARRETEAVEKQDFTSLMRIVDDRTTLGERLEIYHRQISALKVDLGQDSSRVFEGSSARRTRQIIAQIQEQDALTRPLLMGACRSLGESVGELTRKQQCTNAYMKESTGFPVACDQHA